MLWKGKEKEKKRETGGSGDQNGLLLILSLFIVTGFYVLRQGGATAHTSSYDRSTVRVAARTTVVCACALQGFPCAPGYGRRRLVVIENLYRDRLPTVPCRDRGCSALCRDRHFRSQWGLGWCCDRVFCRETSVLRVTERAWAGTT